MKCRTTLQARPIHSSPPSFSKKVNPSTPFSRNQHQNHQKCTIRTRLVVRYDQVNVGLYAELKQHTDAYITMVETDNPAELDYLGRYWRAVERPCHHCQAQAALWPNQQL